MPTIMEFISKTYYASPGTAWFEHKPWLYSLSQRVASRQPAMRGNQTHAILSSNALHGPSTMKSTPSGQQQQQACSLGFCSLLTTSCLKRWASWMVMVSAFMMTGMMGTCLDSSAM